MCYINNLVLTKLTSTRKMPVPTEVIGGHMIEKKERFTVVRHMTGEEIETTDNLTWLFGKQARGDFYMIHRNIVNDRSMTLTDIRVYFALCDLMIAGGWVLQTQHKISERLGIAPPHVAASVSKLKAAGYVTRSKHGKTGRELLRVNPAHTSKGFSSMRKSDLCVAEDSPEYK